MSDVAIVCQGALCKCQFGNTPDTFTVISTHKEYVNETNGSQKMIGTTMDIGQPFQVKTFGQCKLQPTSSGFLPCIPNIVQWQGFYEKVTISNQGKILTENSKAICAIAGSPCVEFTFHGQTGTPTQQQAQQTDEAVHSQINPLANPQREQEQEAVYTLISEDEENIEKEEFKVTLVEGPYDEKGNKAEYISPKKSYYYYASLENYLACNVEDVTWTVIYDNSLRTQRTVFYGGELLKDGRLKIKLQLSKGEESVEVFAHAQSIPNLSVKTTVKFKKVIQ